MMSLLVIILAMLIALSLFIFLLAAAQNNTEDKVSHEIDWAAVNDAELQSYLPDKKIAAIKRYRELTGLGLKEAKQAIDYIVAHPEQKKVKSGLAANTGGAGVRDLVLDGRIDEAVTVYAAFMGVDEFTARDAINELQREIHAEANLSDDVDTSLREMVARGEKIKAIQYYMEQSGVSLKDAKQYIETDLK